MTDQQSSGSGPTRPPNGSGADGAGDIPATGQAGPDSSPQIPDGAVPGGWPAAPGVAPQNPWGQPPDAPGAVPGQPPWGGPGAVPPPEGWPRPQAQGPTGPGAWTGPQGWAGPQGWNGAQPPQDWAGGAPQAAPDPLWGQAAWPQEQAWAQGTGTEWGGPAEMYGPPPPPKKRRTTLYSLLAVVVALAVAGAAVGIVLATRGSATPAAAPSPASHITTRPTATATATTTQSGSLTAAVIFPSTTLNGTGDTPVSLTKVTTFQSADCTKMLPTAAISALQDAGCDEVVAGTYKTTDGTAEVTVSVYDLQDLDAAKSIALYDGDLFDDSDLPVLQSSGPNFVSNGTYSDAAAGTRQLVLEVAWLANGKQSYTENGQVLENAAQVLGNDATQHLPASPSPSPTVSGAEPAPGFTSAYLFYGVRVPGQDGGFDMVRKQTADSTSCATRLGASEAAAFASAGCTGVASALYQTVDGRLYSSVSVFSLSSSSGAESLSDNDFLDDTDLSTVNPLLPAGGRPPATADIEGDIGASTYLIVTVTWWADGTSADNYSPLLNMQETLFDVTDDQLYNLPDNS